MKIVLALLAGLAIAGSAQAQRFYSQAELDAMLAPIALQTDGVVAQVLMAATYPEEVAEAAAWSRANPHLRGDDAVRAAHDYDWDPSVKALVAFPELVQRMDESPQWLQDLGEAFSLQQAQVMDTVQALRRRAQGTGHLASTDQTAVYQDSGAIVVQPRTQIVYVPYYDPYVVYGPWWWPHYRPVHWHPWTPRPVFLAHGFFYSRPDWHRRHVHVVHRPVHVHPSRHHVTPGKWSPRHGVRQFAPRDAPSTRPYVRVPESQRRPIVNSGPQPRPQAQPQARPQAQPRMREGVRSFAPSQRPMPAANGFSQQRPNVHLQRPMPQQRRDANRRDNRGRG
jgi:hypothetical protein